MAAVREALRKSGGTGTDRRIMFYLAGSL
eukprot:COSAG06_NODE_40088_length_405_cov_1.784314_1_plen_28_part_01